MEFLVELGLSDTQVKLVETIALLVVLLLIRLLARRELDRRIDDTDVLYRGRKTIGYVLFTIMLTTTVLIWLEPLQNLGTFLGLASAGLAIALSDLLKNLAGWAYIVVRRPFRVDDRIQIRDQAGDVIDIRPIATTMLEIRDWVDADQSTGRILHVPNGQFLSESVENFTQGFNYLWHEIEVVVTFESDWQRAEELLFDITEELTAAVCDRAREDIRSASREYKIRYTHFTPIVYVRAKPFGVGLTARMLVPVRERRSYDQRLWRSLLAAFAAEPDVTLAYPTIRTTG